MLVYQKLKNGFTLMEVMIVVIIIGIIVGLGIPNYYAVVERSYMQDAMTQLRMIHKAQKMYCARYLDFYPPVSDPGPKDINDINAALDLNIYGNGFSYQCSRVAEWSGGPDILECVAEREGQAYYVIVDDSPLDEVNPCCRGYKKSCPDSTRLCP